MPTLTLKNKTKYNTEDLQKIFDVLNCSQLYTDYGFQQYQCQDDEEMVIEYLDKEKHADWHEPDDKGYIRWAISMRAWGHNPGARKVVIMPYKDMMNTMGIEALADAVNNEETRALPSSQVPVLAACMFRAAATRYSRWGGNSMGAAYMTPLLQEEIAACVVRVDDRAPKGTAKKSGPTKEESIQRELSFYRRGLFNEPVYSASWAIHSRVHEWMIEQFTKAEFHKARLDKMGYVLKPEELQETIPHYLRRAAEATYKELNEWADYYEKHGKLP